MPLYPLAVMVMLAGTEDAAEAGSVTRQLPWATADVRTLPRQDTETVLPTLLLANPHSGTGWSRWRTMEEPKMSGSESGGGGGGAAAAAAALEAAVAAVVAASSTRTQQARMAAQR